MEVKISRVKESLNKTFVSTGLYLLQSSPITLITQSTSLHVSQYLCSHFISLGHCDPMSSLFVDDEDNQQVKTPLAQSPEPERNHDLDIPLISTDEPVDTRTNPIPVHLSLPLRFQQTIVQELIQEDALLVLGKGLGLEPIVANLLHVLSAPSVVDQAVKKRSLVILLNALEDENEKISEELMELSWIDSMAGEGSGIPFHVVSGETLVDKRKTLYQTGGIISVSSRVFVVDLLSGIVLPELVTGLVVLHAERISETSAESFIISLYRKENKWGFLKAASDEPESFTWGFRPLYAKLKDLQLHRTLIRPRFYVDVAKSLKPKRGKETSNVTEVKVELSGPMKQIQIAILACIEACISELKRHNAEIATEYWSMENVLDENFVTRIRRTLDPVWHRVSWTTKQVAFDIATLKDLLHCLLLYDSIQFYEIVSHIFEMNKPSPINSQLYFNSSPWLMLDEATTILNASRKRAFDKVSSSSSQEESCVLEEQPKWEQLAILLDDIVFERSHSTESAAGPVLIMCNDNKTSARIREYLVQMKVTNEDHQGNKSFSGRRMMVQRARDHLDWKRDLDKTKKALETDAQPEETENIQMSKTFTRDKGNLGKRRRTRGGSFLASVGRLHGKTHEAQLEVDENDVKILEAELDDEDDDVEILEPELVPELHTQIGDLQLKCLPRKDQVIVEKYNNRTDDLLLHELMPSYIIMYEPNLAFIRRLEIFSAIHRESTIKTYLMYYGESVEEQKYLNDIKKEKEAFTKIIREKGSLATHFQAEHENGKFAIAKKDVVNTRIAGGSKFRTEMDEMRVVVDIREFRSSLPNLLHRVGIKVLPCMITVGDYIVSPRRCVERKSVPDLISSFKSGRLYTQCEQMLRHYEIATLLIEFDENKSFSLEPFSDSRPMRSGAVVKPSTSKFLQQDIQSKLTMLLVAFPKLRLLWSSSPYQTAQIFLELKKNQEEPDPQLAVSVGLDPAIVENGNSPQFNDKAIDLIQSIPGINVVNYHLVIQKVKNIQQLCNMSEEKLADIIGKEAAVKAKRFIEKNVLK